MKASFPRQGFSRGFEGGRDEICNGIARVTGRPSAVPGRWLCAALCAALAFDADTAFAQSSAGGPQVGEVTVTARWREERLQETPVSITAFTAPDLQARHLTNLSQIAAFTPNLVFDPGTGDTGGSANAQVYIRGVGQSDFLFTSEPGVGIYVDGVYMARSIGSMMDLIDVERVEVLRGPQGTVFGKNSVGGAINVITRAPASEAGARGSVTLGGFDRLDLFAAEDLPIVPERLLGKLSVFFNHRNGYVARSDGESLGDVNALGASMKLQWSPVPAFEARLSADYERRRESSSPLTLIAVAPSAPLLALWNGLVGAPMGSVYDGRFVPGDPFANEGTAPQHSHLYQGGGSVTADWLTGRGTLRSVTAVRRQVADFATDGDQSPVDYARQDVHDRTTQISQEIQWLGSALGGRLHYVAGALHFSEQGRDIYRVQFAPGLYQAVEAMPPGVIPGLGGSGNPADVGIDYDGAITDDIDNRSEALFLHADLQVTDRLSLSGGLRQTWDHKDYRARFDRLAAGVTAYDVSPRQSWQAFTPAASAEYRWTPELMTYVSAARGYKAGGFNGRAQTAFVAQQPFAPEYVWTYEAGLKSAWFDRRAVLDLAIFHSDYSDMQLTSLGVDGGAPVILVQNAGAARVDGFELEGAAVPWTGMRLNFGLGHLHGRYTELAPTVVGVTLSSQLAKTPAWTSNLGMEQGFETALGRITARTDYAYRSKVQNTADNVEILAQKGFGLLQAQLTLAPRRGAWTVTIFGSNLTDVRYITNGLSALDSIGLATVAYGRPREWGIRLDYRM